MKRPSISPALRYQVFRDHGAIALCQVCGDSQRIANMALARELHHAVLVLGEARAPGKIKSRGFDRAFKKKMNGTTERRQEP